MVGRLTPGERAFQFANNGLLTAIALLCCYPFFLVLVLSFNSGSDARSGGIYLWPRKPTVENYATLLADPAILRAYGVSVGRTVLGTALHIGVTASVAFGMSRRELVLRKTIAVYFLITFLFSGGIIPTYLLLRSLGLLNRFWVYVVPPIFNVYAMLVMMTFFREIPESLVESAMVEGAGYFRVLLSIVLPLSKPMLAAMSLFAAVWHWNDWFSGFFYVSTINLQTLQNFLQRALESMTRIAGVSAALEQARGIAVSGSEISAKQLELTYRSLRMAVIMITVLPVLAVYPFVQRSFTRGVLIGSIKE